MCDSPYGRKRGSLSHHSAHKCNDLTPLQRSADMVMRHPLRNDEVRRSTISPAEANTMMAAAGTIAVLPETPPHAPSTSRFPAQLSYSVTKQEEKEDCSISFTEGEELSNGLLMLSAASSSNPRLLPTKSTDQRYDEQGESKLKGANAGLQSVIHHRHRQECIAAEVLACQQLHSISSLQPSSAHLQQVTAPFLQMPPYLQEWSAASTNSTANPLTYIEQILQLKHYLLLNKNMTIGAARSDQIRNQRCDDWTLLPQMLKPAAPSLLWPELGSHLRFNQAQEEHLLVGRTRLAAWHQPSASHRSGVGFDNIPAPPPSYSASLPMASSIRTLLLNSAANLRSDLITKSCDYEGSSPFLPYYTASNNMMRGAAGLLRSHQHRPSQVAEFHQQTLVKEDTNPLFNKMPSPLISGEKREFFPKVLHRALVQLDLVDGGTHIANFLPDGKSFRIRDQFLFEKRVLPAFFPRMKGFASFQRQLNLYDFKRNGGAGTDRGSYYHELFVREEPVLLNTMKRKKIKGTGHSRRGVLDEARTQELWNRSNGQ